MHALCTPRRPRGRHVACASSNSTSHRASERHELVARRAVCAEHVHVRPIVGELALELGDAGLHGSDVGLEALELGGRTLRGSRPGRLRCASGLARSGRCSTVRTDALRSRSMSAQPPSYERSAPSSIATIRSGTASSSARSCETSSTVPGNASSAASSASRDSTSRWFVGSSRTRKFAPDATSEREREAPALAARERRDRALVRLPAGEEEAARGASAPAGAAARSRPRSRRAPTPTWAARARAARSSRERRRGRAGSSRARADAPSSSAASSVVLPAPLGPTSPTFSPRSTTIVAPSSSRLSPARQSDVLGLEDDPSGPRRVEELEPERARASSSATRPPAAPPSAPSRGARSA